MKRPTFSEGVVVALSVALFGSIAHSVLPGLLGPAWTTRILIAAIGLAYVVYLLVKSRERTGRLVTLTAWLVLAGIGWSAFEDPWSYLALHLGLIWLVRSLYHQPGPLAALLDLALNLLALMAGVWAFGYAGSLFLSIWTFFLVQALFVAIPSAKGGHRDSGKATDDRFQRAHRSAEAALRKLSAHR